MVAEPRVRTNIKSEKLISAKPYQANRIVVLGTAESGRIAVSAGVKNLTAEDVDSYGNFSAAEKVFGTYDPFTGQTELRLMRGIEHITAGGSNFFYPMRICDGTESGGGITLRGQNDSLGESTFPLMYIRSKDSGSYSQNIEMKITDNLDSPFAFSEVIKPTGDTHTGHTLRHYPSMSTNEVYSAEAGATAYLTGQYHTKVLYGDLIDDEGNKSADGEVDWSSLTEVTLRYEPFNTNTALAGNFDLASADDAIMITTSGSPFGHNLLFDPDNTYVGKGTGIVVQYWYDVKDVELRWGNRVSESFKVNSANNMMAVINSGSSLVTAECDTGDGSFGYKMPDSGSWTAPMNMSWTSLGAGGDGRTVGYNDYKAAIQIVNEMAWDYLVLPGCSDKRVFQMVKSLLTIAEKNNREHKAVLGTDSGMTLAETKQYGTTGRDKRIFYVSAGKQGQLVTNRYTGNEETGASSYTACTIAGNIASRVISDSILGKDLLGVDGIKGGWSKTQREELLNYGIMTIKVEGGGYKANDAITSSFTTDFGRIIVLNIVDYAKQGTRSIAQQFKGKRNIPRVWSAMEFGMNNFLKQMAKAEHLVSFQKVQVHATRGEQISGTTRVTMALSPTYEIRDIDVDINLE